MKAKARQYGVTLVEMTVVVAIVALLVSLGLPAIRALLNSFESQQGAHTLISSSLASARALAAREQRYAGIRFQHKYEFDPGAGIADFIQREQYMVFIVHDPDPAPDGTEYTNGFRAVEGLDPIKLPESVGVMEVIQSNGDVDQWQKLVNRTTFSVVFSPSGKLVIHLVRAWNKNGSRTSSSPDDIFNTKTKVDNGMALLYQDDYPADGLDQEQSCNSFIVYDRNLFDKVDVTKRYSDCLSKSETVYINPYTGTMIKR
jgi:prepilin-type N-terminal cleavage/methylation domain-containing protein